MSNAQFYDSQAPSIRLYHQFSLAQHVGGGIRFGWPIFELDTFTELELHHLKSQDQLIVCSRWAEDVIRQNNIHLPVHVVPLGVDTSIFYPNKLKGFRDINPFYPPSASFTQPQIREMVKEETTVFINVGKKELRKGHDVILECFENAFTKDDNVELWMVWGNRILDQFNPKESRSWTEMYNNSVLRDKIRLFEWLPSQEHVARLFNMADCALFPSRAEGFNLDAIEAMACALPTILTNYSAHTEFATEKNALLIDVDDKQPAFDGVWFHGQGNWANFGNNQKEQLISHMKNIYQLKLSRSDLTNKEGILTGQKFTWKNSAEKLLEAIL